MAAIGLNVASREGKSMQRRHCGQANADRVVRAGGPVAASVLAMLICAGAAHADTSPSAAQLSIDGQYVQVASDWDALVDQWRSRSAAGMRLTDVERYDNNEGAGYVARWEQGDDEDFLGQAASWGEFEAKILELASGELRLVDVEIFFEQGEARYLGVWRSGGGNFALWTCPSWDAFTDTWQEMSMSGLQLIDIEVYRDQGITNYFGLFRSDMSEETLWKDEDWDEVSQ